MWESDMQDILRVMLDDTDTPQRYSEAKLLQLLVVSAFHVKCDIQTRQTYDISISNQSISPDPTVEATQDDAFVNLVTQKAACTLDRSSAILAAGRAIAARDGSSSVDLRGVFGAKLQLLEKGWCAVYEDTKRDYQLGRLRAAGAVVMTPFRLLARGHGALRGTPPYA